MAPPIPDRWLNYSPVGKNIKETRFIAFKVPLRDNVVQNVPNNIRLSCGSLLNKIPDLGMIIDLTSTTRYYDPHVFKKKGVRYEKLMIPGQKIPPPHCVKRFAILVKNFLQENADNDKLIGVHCTHGVNRTGYLISSFLISEMEMTPEKAIERVEQARGHAIERENYKDDLKNNSQDRSNWKVRDNPFSRENKQIYRPLYQRTYNEYNNYSRDSTTSTSTSRFNYENWRSRDTVPQFSDNRNYNVRSSYREPSHRYSQKWRNESSKTYSPVNGMSRTSKNYWKRTNPY